MGEARSETAVVRLVIADDQTLFRQGLARLLQSDSRIDVVGEAADGEVAVTMAEQLRPDVILMDVHMPVLDGITATLRISKTVPDVKVLMLSTFDGEGEIVPALRAGARGYLLKDSKAESIINCVLAVWSGERVMAGSVADRMLDWASSNSESTEYYDGLTPRELEILTLLASGLANKQAAYSLKISPKTVRNHVTNIYQKLQVVDRPQAVLYAVRKGLVQA